MNYEQVLAKLRELPIVKRALEELAEKLPATLRYHVAAHTDDVLGEVILFGIGDQLSERDLTLLAIAAAYHDIGFVEASKENEGLGAQRAVEAMRAEGGYSEEEMSKVSTAILDTQLKFLPEGPRQVSTLSFSHHLLDADMSNLGRDDFFEKAELVRLEVGVDDKKAFYFGVEKLLKAHQWYSKSAQSLRQQKKESNMGALEQYLRQL